jgi:probable phosphoglycerate mutase
MAPPLDLYLVRHGATEWSENGRHTGRTDLPLLPQGRTNAERLRPRLASVSFSAAFTSDLRRAKETAELAGFAAAQATPLLREFDYGEYEGLTTPEITRTRPGWELFRDGCPGGESPQEAYARAQAFLRLLDGLEGNVIVFSHGHFLRIVACAWTELEVTAGARFALDTATISILRDGDRGRVVQAWNSPG